MNSQSTRLNDELFDSAYWITSRVAVGKNLTPERARHLRDGGITHILNVGENPCVVRPVHCLAGQNRSPTVLWLFLVASWLDAEQAKQLITDRSYDAVPGHRALVNGHLVQSVIEHGKQIGLNARDVGLNQSEQ